MHGIVYLLTVEEVAQFLAAFAETGSTDEFEVNWNCSAKGYSIRFTGAQ